MLPDICWNGQIQKNILVLYENYGYVLSGFSQDQLENPPLSTSVCWTIVPPSVIYINVLTICHVFFVTVICLFVSCNVSSAPFLFQHIYEAPLSTGKGATKWQLLLLLLDSSQWTGVSGQFLNKLSSHMNQPVAGWFVNELYQNMDLTNRCWCDLLVGVCALTGSWS